MSTPWNILNRVHEERSARSWSQAELARRAGISRAEISAIETGRLRSPSTGAALALSAAFGLPVEELFRVARKQDATWAWDPPADGDRRYWRAQLAERELLYPVERTLLGALPHDGLAPLTASGEPSRTVVLAGCDPAVGLLANAVGRLAGVRVLAFTRSSRRALELLAAGRVHLAGVHLGDNLREARRALPDQNPLLVQVARWDAGLAFAPDQRLSTVGTALRAELRWVGREEGSGAHRLVERVLRAEGAERPPGLDRTARDHIGVAETIRSGWAQLGPCVRLAAEQSGLGFLSIERQTYELCTTGALREDPAVAAVLEVLGSAAFRRQLGELPGYDTKHTGRTRDVA